jgi:SAM-dependent methyltransferase
MSQQNDYGLQTTYDCTIARVTNRPLIYYRDMVRPPEDTGAAKAHSTAGWIRDAFRARGFAGALRYFAAGSIDLLRDLSPSRRRSRFGDIEYDFDHQVDTTWANIPVHTRIRELLSGGQYQPSEPELFHRILNALPVAPDGFTFIDLGSGKGRTLLMASDYAFRRIVGVEILAELHEVACSNIARYAGEQQKCFALESHAGDARDFDLPAEPIVLYLFNPFPEHVLRAVLGNLRKSLSEAPRPVYVVYHNLVQERVFAEQSWLRVVYRAPEFAIYTTLR